MIAIIASLLLISLYIGLRFEFKFAVPVLIALAHDLLITAGVYAIFQREVSTATVAALLTILGYSLYDTIIVFDRIRENVPRMPRATFSQIVNRSMAEVLTRSLATSFSTLLPILALMLFGGETLKDFGFALLVGVASGTYSSIFIASPVLTHWKEREPVYVRRRQLALEDFGGVVPAYAPGTFGEPVEEPAAPAAPRQRPSRPTRSRRVGSTRGNGPGDGAGLGTAVQEPPRGRAEVQPEPPEPEVEEPAVEEPAVEEPAVEEAPAAEQPALEEPQPADGGNGAADADGDDGADAPSRGRPPTRAPAAPTARRSRARSSAARRGTVADEPARLGNDGHRPLALHDLPARPLPRRHRRRLPGRRHRRRVHRPGDQRLQRAGPSRHPPRAGARGGPGRADRPGHLLLLGRPGRARAPAP